MNPDQQGETRKVRPLARSLTELAALSSVELVSGLAAFTALLVLEDSSKVLVGCGLALAFMFGVWFPAWSRAESRRRTRAGAQALRPAPPEAPREEPSATVRRILSGRVRVFPLLALLALLPSMMYGPGPGNAAILVGVTVGMIIAAGLESLGRAVKVTRWQRTHRRAILLEVPYFWPPRRRKPRHVYYEASTDDHHGKPPTATLEAPPTAAPRELRDGAR